ncbi:hypothetical protein NP493_60g05050 [Ridgeia piscesae]|uniref:Uncharacterized protein n=1 Tax=Ridgeia piscesae TaxID=27915 RepID=A0AAD9UIS4_RIDPI|nr:hypothetical protein NP493_60g05050 [Ridgeia piscesae]
MCFFLYVLLLGRVVVNGPLHSARYSAIVCKMRCTSSSCSSSGTKNTNKPTSLAPVFTENPSTLAEQNQRLYILVIMRSATGVNRWKELLKKEDLPTDLPMEFKDSLL